MASQKPRSNSLPPALSRYSSTWPYDYSPLSGSRAIRLLFIESQSRDYTRHFITGRLEVVNLEDFERRYVALSYTWGPAIREGFTKPGDGSRFIPSYELLVAGHPKTCVQDDCSLHDSPGASAAHARGYTSLALAPNLSDYFTYHAQWHIQECVPIWIDAICINQQDPLEVADQIVLQADIYTMARQTNVWLGACQRDLHTFAWWHDTVYQALAQERSRKRQSPYMLDLVFKTGNHLDDNFWLENFGLSAPQGASWHDCWRSYVDFFLVRRWFSRLWTIQEVMLAQKVYMFCGPRRFDFSDVLNLDRWLLSSFLRAKQSHNTTGANTEQIWPRWNPGYIFEIIRTRINHVQLQGFSPDTTVDISLRLSYLLGILQCARGQETTFPRDKVLGLLGVATRFVPKDMVQLLVRDLRGSDRDVFVSFARYYIHSQCLGILSYAGHRHDLSDPSWPSWVPNWDDVSQSGFYDFPSSPLGRPLAARDTGSSLSIAPNAVLGEEDGICIPRVIGETLVLHGVCMGVIVESYTRDDLTRHFGSFCSLLGPMYCLTGEPAHEALLRTTFRTAVGDPEAQRIGVEEIHQFLLYLRAKLVRDGMANPRSIRSLEALLLSQPSMHPDLCSTIKDALSEIKMFTGEQVAAHSHPGSGLVNRMEQSRTVSQSFSNEVQVMQTIFNIFVTAEGVLGNGSKSIKPGDEIWVVKHGPVPLILERGTDGQRFRLIGTSYVHGVEYDKIFRGKRAENMVELRIV